MTLNLLIYKHLFISLENPVAKIHRTGVSTFAIRTSQRTDQKLQKSLQAQRTKTETK
jgi:hypothetical protein